MGAPGGPPSPIALLPDGAQNRSGRSLQSDTDGI